MTLTIFSWGYAGWGYATGELVPTVDTIEAGRGYQPPCFIDIRASRNVRAAGFRDSAFANLLGNERHLWMPTLGLRAGGQPIAIDNPAAVQDLLALALERARTRQRVIFFCGCPYPRCEGKRACHRDLVSVLLLRAARALGRRLRVVEWPGGKPGHIDREVSETLFRALGRDTWSVPLTGPFDRAAMAGLPHGSVVTVHTGTEYKHLVCGPAQVTAGEWFLPVFAWSQGTTLDEALARGRRHRRQYGFLARRSLRV
jgi:hypothetical protein